VHRPGCRKHGESLGSIAIAEEHRMFESLYAMPDHMTFGGLERRRQELHHALGLTGHAPASIRSVVAGTWPPLNIITAENSVEICVYAPGIDATRVDITVDRGVLMISGERATNVPHKTEKVSIYANERASGAFKRAINLPDDVDPTQVKATYVEGLLRIFIARTATPGPQRIIVQ